MCVTAHRSTRRYKEELAGSRGKVDEIQELLNKTTDANEKSLREAQRARKVAEGREEGLRIDLTTSEDRLKEVEGKVRTGVAKRRN